MSWLSSAVKGIGHVVGKVASNPIVTGAAGLFGGPLAGALTGGLGHLLAPGGNIGSAIGGAATGGLAGAIRPLGGGLLGKIGGFAGGNLGTLIGGSPHAEDGFGFGGGGGLGGFLQGAVRSLGGGGGLGGLLGGGGGGLGGLGNLAVGGLAGYQALNAANASKRAGQFQDHALGLAENRWNEAAPLRTAGATRLLTPARPDLTAAYADPTNPFARSAVRPLGR